jgi:hypothetical protein
MNIEKVHETFSEMINIPGIYRRLKITKNNVAQYRWKLKRGVHITIDKKLLLLQRAGYHLDSFKYTDRDLAEAIRFTIRASNATKNMGPEYLLEKWKASKSN